MYGTRSEGARARVLHFLANFDFKLARAIFSVKIRQLSLLQNFF